MEINKAKFIPARLGRITIRIFILIISNLFFIESIETMERKYYGDY